MNIPFLSLCDNKPIFGDSNSIIGLNSGLGSSLASRASEGSDLTRKTPLLKVSHMY